MLGYAYLSSLNNANSTYKKFFIINAFVIKTIKLSCVDTYALSVKFLDFSAILAGLALFLPKREPFS